VDYLLKPYSRDRLRAALDRVRGRQARVGPTAAALRSAARPGQLLERVVVRDGAHVHVIAVDKIDYVRGAGRLRRVSHGRRTLLRSRRWAIWKGSSIRAGSSGFHRFVLLNLDRLARVELYAKE